jgi:hypothetical protein
MTLDLRVRRLHAFPILLALALTGGLAFPLSAQVDRLAGSYPVDELPVADVDWSDDIPAHISVVDGAATLERDGRIEPAEENMALLAGDRLVTERGRLEILFSDGSAIAVDELTDVEFLDDTLVRLDRGRIRITVARSRGDLEYRIDAAGTTAWIRSAGEYRVAVVQGPGPDPELRVAVMRGSAEVSSPHGRTLVMAGYEAVATANTFPSRPYAVTAASWDPFDRWADEQEDFRTGYRSALYLPAEVRYYSGVFDRYGTWEYEQPYGYVWYPTVAVGWRPYYHGHWTVVGSFGWFWVGGGRWSWPTHHYGRWGVKGARWYWMPGRYWAPAWVSWASAPGYVSWSPLGWNNQPLFALSMTHVDTWRGWTVVPTRYFGAKGYVTRYAVPDRTHLPGDARFAVRRTAPVRPTVSVRADAPLRGPGARPRYAEPRTQSAAGSFGLPGQRPATREVAPRRASPSAASTALGGDTTRSSVPRARARTAPSTGDGPSPSPSPRAGLGTATSRGLSTSGASRASGRVAAPRSGTATAPQTIDPSTARAPARVSPTQTRPGPTAAPRARSAPPAAAAPAARSSPSAGAPSSGGSRPSRVQGSSPSGGASRAPAASSGSGGSASGGRAQPRSR